MTKVRHLSALTAVLLCMRGVAAGAPEDQAPGRERSASDATAFPVHINEVTADSTPLSLGIEITIPSGRRRIAIEFAGLRSGPSQNLRYRYKLDDFDRGWSGPMSGREAVYTNLNPGTYRFHVRATDAAGAGNQPETTVLLRVQAEFWQAWWFRALFLGGVCFIGFAMYRFRLRQVTAELDMRFEERLSERTRIAQDLHDTLLQGFLSASMQLHVAAGRLEADSPARPPLERAIDLMTQAGNEGRAALRELRSDQEHEKTLEQAFSSIPGEVFMPADVRFRLRVEGKPRPLRPVLRDDVYRICREAILNAIRHSQAKEIDVEVVYASSELCILTQDNGRGMEIGVVQSGRQGHWGLQGMRERADRIGATLAVLSHPGAGTEVVLSVPGHIAYASSKKSGWKFRYGRKIGFNRAQAPVKGGEI